MHFKDQKGKAIDGQLIIGEVESIREKEFYKPVEVEVERNLGRFKKVLAYLGVIKSTKKVIKQELHKEKVVSKLKSKNSTLTYDETVLKKNGKIFAIEKNGKFLDLEGKALKDTLIKKESGVYYLDIAPNVKYFDKEKEVETKKVKKVLIKNQKLLYLKR